MASNWESVDAPHLVEWGMGVARLERDGEDGPAYVMLQLTHGDGDDEAYAIAIPPSIAIAISTQLVITAHMADPGIIGTPPGTGY